MPACFAAANPPAAAMIELPLSAIPPKDSGSYGGGGGFSASAKTKFNKMKKIFEGARTLPINLFRSDLAFLGKCVSRFAPESPPS